MSVPNEGKKARLAIHLSPELTAKIDDLSERTGTPRATLVADFVEATMPQALSNMQAVLDATKQSKKELDENAAKILADVHSQAAEAQRKILEALVARATN